MRGAVGEQPHGLGGRLDRAPALVLRAEGSAEAGVQGGDAPEAILGCETAELFMSWNGVRPLRTREAPSQRGVIGPLSWVMIRVVRRQGLEPRTR